MASIREMKTLSSGTRWQAVVRKKGYQLTRAFATQANARKWSATVEAAITLSGPTNPFDEKAWKGHETISQRAVARQRKAEAAAAVAPNDGWTCKQALEHYEKTASQKKASPAQESSRIKQLIQSFGDVELAQLKSWHIQRHIEARGALGKSAATIRLEVMQMRAVWRHAKAEKPAGWALTLPKKHPFGEITIPELPTGRDRRLENAFGDKKLSEEDALRAALAEQPDGEELLDIFNLALLTGMRRGEILGLQKNEISNVQGVTMIVKKKHKTSRHKHIRKVLLNDAALLLIEKRYKQANNDNLFEISKERLKHFWRKSCRIAKVEDFHFHDLRHESISRVNNMPGSNLALLKAFSGHRSAAMLMRYTNPKDQEVLDFLNG